MRPLTKVVGKNRFELMYRIKKREAQGWKRGKIRHETNRVRHFDHRGMYGQYTGYAGDTITQQYECWMWKEDKKA